MSEVHALRAPQEAQAAAPEADIEAITFDLQGETFALEAGIVQEIIDMMPVTHVPGAAAFVSGVINFRGKVIPLADLRLAFGMDAPDATIDSRIIVVEWDIDGTRSLIGLRTDKVHEVTTLECAALEDEPRVGMRWRADFIKTLYRRRGEFIIYPDLVSLFAAQFATTPAQHASRH
jgi:purine-binding chemotaxis protein CheW